MINITAKLYYITAIFQQIKPFQTHTVTIITNTANHKTTKQHIYERISSSATVDDNEMFDRKVTKSHIVSVYYKYKNINNYL